MLAYIIRVIPVIKQSVTMQFRC